MSAAFDAIRDFFGDRTAERSGVPLINHITEGLEILERIGSTQAAKDAFCLHPMFQADADLIANLPRVGEFSPYVMMLVMEYRARANEALSDRVTKHRAGHCQWVGLPPTPGPLAEVRDMLIADKVQNRKDFLLYHAGTHPRTDELRYYFDTWIRMLSVRSAADLIARGVI